MNCTPLLVFMSHLRANRYYHFANNFARKRGFASKYLFSSTTLLSNEFGCAT